MENLILISNIILALLLVGSVLLQKSEGGALGLGVSQESFISSRSAGSFLTKFTAIIATLFIITSISLTIISKENLPSILCSHLWARAVVITLAIQASKFVI